MEITTERECSALGGLFQTIVNDMKGSIFIWEDFTSKATKLHSSLKATLIASTAFLESFQKVADSATNTRGATRDIGKALTRLCIRHKAIENKLKNYTYSIMDALVVPIQERMQEWKTTIIQLDKDHAKEYKKARQEIKRVSTDTIRLQKKVKKGKCNMQTQLESAMREVNDKYTLLEETEKMAVRSAMVEERNRFCTFVNFLKPVVEEEVSMLTEVTHLQEILETLSIHTVDPSKLPAASEQVIIDLKVSLNGGNGDSVSLYQTPPSSPSSLGSRKSSMCSINSLNSSSSGSSKSHSPSHHNRYKNQQQLAGTMRLTSISSQDSGFMSQDTLYLKPITPPPNQYSRQLSALGDGSNMSSNAAYPAPPSATGTMSRWPDHQRTDVIDFDRPHTISTAYEKNHSRPSLTAQTFEPPILERPYTPTEENPYQELHNHVEMRSHTAPTTPCYRPTSVSKPNKPQVMKEGPPVGPKPKPKAVPTPTVPCKLFREDSEDLADATYVNLNEIANMAANHCKKEVTSSKEITNEEEPIYEDSIDLMAAVRALEESTLALHDMPDDDTMGSDTYQAPSNSELADAIRELEASTAALEKTYDSSSNSSNGSRMSHLSLQSSSGYGTGNSTPTASEDAINTPAPETDFPPPIPDGFDNYEVTPYIEQYATMPRNREPVYSGMMQRHSIAAAGMPIVRNGTATISRRASLNSPKPPPPVRRSSSITYTGTPRTPRSRSRQRTDSGSSVYNNEDYDLPPPPPPAEIESSTAQNDGNLSMFGQDLNRAIAARKQRSEHKQKQQTVQSSRQKSNMGQSSPRQGRSPRSMTCTYTDTVRNVGQGRVDQQKTAEAEDTSPQCEIVNDVSESRANLIQTLNAKFGGAPKVQRSNSQMDSSQQSHSVNRTPKVPLVRRGSFLDQITYGVRLQRTVTNDRSAPYIPR